MTWTVELSRSALRFLQRCPPDLRMRLLGGIEKLEKDPFPRGSVKLQGRPGIRRLRSGECRILYHTVREEEVILVFRIERRAKAYR